MNRAALQEALETLFRCENLDINVNAQNILHNAQRTLECAEAVVLYGHSVIWHSDHEDVKWLENLLSRLEPEDYLFLRIEKETGVMESKGQYRDNPFGMRVVRVIAFD